MKTDVIKVDLEPRMHLDFASMIADAEELELIGKVCDCFFETYRPELRAERLSFLKNLPVAGKMIYFKWFDYRIARRWLATRQALAATLTLRTRFPARWTV